MFKKNNILFFIFFVAAGIASFSINFYVDPNNYFHKKSDFMVLAGNERNIKSVFLKNNPHQYNALLIGSSRPSYIDTTKLKGYKMFNYSVSGIGLQEYLPFLKFFKEMQGEPELIILCLDFYTTNINYIVKDLYIDALEFARNPFKKYIDYLKVRNLYSSFQIYFNQYSHYYTRNLVKRTQNLPSTLSDEIMLLTLNGYRSTCYKNYVYNESYIQELKKIKAVFSKSRIIVVICPVHISLFDLAIKIAGKQTYQKWLRDIKTVFSECYDFNDDVNMVGNRRNFFDGGHFFPFVGDVILSETSKKL